STGSSGSAGSAGESAQADRLAAALVEELGRRLADDERLQVSDVGMVLAVLGDGKKTESEAIEIVQDALLPDLIVSGGWQRHQDRIKVTYLVRDSKDGHAVKTRSLERPYAELFG